jgi:hypothetical protein
VVKRVRPALLRIKDNTGSHSKLLFFRFSHSYGLFEAIDEAKMVGLDGCRSGSIF